MPEGTAPSGKRLHLGPVEIRRSQRKRGMLPPPSVPAPVFFSSPQEIALSINVEEMMGICIVGPRSYAFTVPPGS